MDDEAAAQQGNCWLTRDMAIGLVEAYGAAWAAQDAEAILALFTDDAVYSERPFASDKAVFTGADELRGYWQRQIRGKQRNIRFRQCADDLLLDADLSRCLAKWEAFFDTRGKDGVYRPVHIIQVAILHLQRPPLPLEQDKEVATTSLPRIARLEEYWHSEAMDSTEKGVEWTSSRSGGNRDKTCWDFLKGQCPRGASCPYAHGTTAPQRSGGTDQPATGAPEQLRRPWTSLQSPTAGDEPPQKRSRPEALIVD